MSGQHNFIVRLRSTKIFSIIIDGISIATSWYLTIRLGITMAANFIALLALMLEIKLKKITITSIIKLTISLIQEIQLKTIAIIASMKQTLKIVVDTIVSSIVISPIVCLIWRFGVINVVVPKIAIINITIIVASFYLLSNHDPSYLWEMDGQSIEDLDYIVV